VLVQSVLDDGPAASAGLKPGDIIRAFEGRRLDITRLRQSIAVTPPGTPVKLEVVRDGKPMQVTATLADLNAANAALNGLTYIADLGVNVVTFPKSEAEKHGPRVPGGVLVATVDPSSPAEEIGLQATNTIIVELDGKAVKSAEQFAKAIEAKNGKACTIRFWRNYRYATRQVGE